MERVRGMDDDALSAKEEPLGVADDDIDFEMGGRSVGSGGGR